MDATYRNLLERRAREVREPSPGFTPDLEASTHKGQRPTIWVALVLLVLSVLGGLTTFLVLRWARNHRGLGEEVPHQAICPQNQLNKAVTAVTVEVASPRGSQRLLAADRQTFHCGTPVRDLYYWQRKVVSELVPNLTDPVVVGLSAQGGKMAVVYEQKGDPRRGLRLASLPADLGDMTMWSRPAIDTSCFAGINDDTASCLVWDGAGGRRLVGGPGVGVYDPARRCWEDVLTRRRGDISSNYVNDLELVGGNILAVAGDGGLDLGRWSAGQWTKTHHIDATRGLVGDNVRIIHAIAPDASSSVADLVYLTAKSGMGKLRADLADGGVTQTQGLIGEGRAEGLTRQSLLRFGEDQARGALWMVYQDPRDKAKLRAGLYQIDDHQMNASRAADSWPGSHDVTLAVDTYAPEPAAWVGGDGLRLVRAASKGTLEVVDAGLNGVDVQEITPGAPAVFVKAKKKTADAPACVYGARRDDAGRRNDPWQYCIGPRRIPGLQLDDITAATDGIFEGQPALFLGTRDKGIGAFLRASRELVRVTGTASAGAAQAAPANGSLDLSAAGAHLAQVGSDRSLHFYDGSSWSAVMPAGGTEIDPGDITAVAAQGPHLVVGSERSIGHYNATTHRWTAIPAVEGLQRLVVAIDRLWAIDRKQALYSCALADATTGIRASGGAANPNMWVLEDPSVLDIYGDYQRVIVIAENEQAHHPQTSYRLWTRTRGARSNWTIVETTPLLGEPLPWTAAAAEGTVLYVAPHGGSVGRYDLTTHQWTNLPLPTDVDAVGTLAVTRDGLWLLDNDRVLFYRPSDGDYWARAAEEVAHIRAGQGVVTAVQTNGNVLMGGPFGRGVPMKTLVGDEFADSLAGVTAGVVFRDRLFVATATRVGRYDAEVHGWHSYEPNVADVVEFASSAASLYGRSATGQLWRWRDDRDIWETVRTSAGQDMHVRQITGSQGDAVVVLDAEGRLEAICDSDKDHPVELMAATRCPARAPFAAAGEIGQDLIVASAEGTVAAYTKPAGKLWTWNAVMDTGESVEQILACPRRSDAFFVVGDGKATLLSKNAADGQWRTVRTVMETDGRMRGDADDAYFYGLVQGDAEDRRLLKAALPDSMDPSTEPPSAPTTVIGERFPVGSLPATAAIGMDETGALYRADESGAVARYSFQGHTWAPEPISGIGQFLQLAGQLWAWSPTQGQLYRRLDKGWEEDGGNWVNVAGDGASMVLVGSRGEVVLRTAQGDRRIIDELPEDLPMQSAADIAALAEKGDTLFAATADGRLVSYDRLQHRWQLFPEVTDAKRFEKLSGTTEEVFAVTQSGKLLRFDGIAQQWIDVLPAGRTATSAVSAGTRLAVVTDEGHLLILDGAGRVVSAYRPGSIGGQGVAQFDIAALAELDGQLLMLPRRDDGDAEIWAYDPRDHSWATHRLDGVPDRFHAAEDGLWIATRQSDSSVTMSRILVTPQLKIGASVGGLCDVSSDGQTVLAVTADGRVRRLEADARLTSLGIAEAALPQGRQIKDLRGVADACVALLDDGSVYHYTMQTRKWERQVPPTPSGRPGTIVNVGAGRALLLIRSDMDLWSCDTGTAVWTEIEPDGVVSLPVLSADVVPSDWEVAAKGADHELTVKVGQRSLVTDLRQGRLGFDRADRIAFSQPNVVKVNMAGGVRTFRMQQGEWAEEGVIETDFSYAKPDPVEFDGEVFAVRRHPEGPFPTAAGRVAISLKLSGTTAQLRPATSATGLAFAHDVIRDVAIHGRNVYLATAGGIVETTTDGTALKMASLHEGSRGLLDPNIVKIVSDGSSLSVQSGRGACYAMSDNGQSWNPINRAVMDQLLAQTSAISRCNTMLNHWRVRQGTGGAELDAIMDAAVAPVSVSQKGFGFDQPKAFGLESDVFRLYTPDGLVTIGRTAHMGPFASLDPSYRLPPLVGFAEVLEPPSTNGAPRPWLRTIAPPQTAWSFDGQRWSFVSLVDYDKTRARLKPYYWDSVDLKWDRQDLVTLRGRPPGSSEVTVHFDAERGRFDTDIVYDLAVFENELWVVAKGGVIRFDRHGEWSHVTQADASGFAPTEDWRVRIIPVPADRGAALVLQGPTGVLEWDGKQWNRSSDMAAFYREVTARLDAHLVYGDTWRLEKVAAQACPISMKARLAAGQSFVDVKLGDDGLFDFERLSKVLATPGTCHVASEFGLYQIDLERGEIPTMVAQSSPVTSLGQLDGKVFARLRSGAVLSYEGQWLPYLDPNDVFGLIGRRIVKQSHWQWERQGAEARVQLLPVAAGLWTGPGVLPVTLQAGRFDFDTVYDAGFAESLWLVTDKGLVPRVGPDFRQIGDPQTLNRVGRGATLAHVTYDDVPTMVLKAGDELYYYFDQAWRPIPPSRRQQVETVLATQVAHGVHFDVRRTAGQLQTSIRIGGSADRYKPAEFDRGKGLFTFDAFNGMCQAATGAGDLALIATAGGVAVYDVGSPAAGSGNGAGAMRHLYCDADSDGLDSSGVERVVHAAGTNMNFAVTRPDTLYQLTAVDAAHPRGRWEPADAAGRAAFEYSRRVLADDAEGWRVFLHKPPTAWAAVLGPFDTRWRGQTVRLMNLQETQDATDSVFRFAHDVPLSVALVNRALWVGTRGGVVVFAADDAKGVDPTRFDIRSAQTLPAGELTGDSTPKGIGCIRAGSSDQLIYARRESDDAVLCCESGKGGLAWWQRPADDDGFVSACRVGEDPIWSWEKDSLRPVRMRPHVQRMHVPANYRYLEHGTWTFLDVNQATARDPRHTMALFRDRLYIGTAGGVTRFTLPDALGDGPASDRRLDADVYGLASSATGLIPLLDVVSLYVDRSEDRLYARTRDAQCYVFDPDRDIWRRWDGPGNPMDRAMVLVDNRMFHWRMTDQGRHGLGVVPLDVVDQSTYPLFEDGRFVFDNVHECFGDADRLWTATDGGICLYTYQDFRPVAFFAKVILDEMRTTAAAAGGPLPAVHEVIQDRDSPPHVRCRTAQQQVYTFDQGSWIRGGDHGAFEEAYRRQTDTLMTWLEYPERRLEVRVRDMGRDVTLGTKGDKTQLGLFGNERFSFDDVRGAVLDGSTMLTATPIGVVEQTLDWDNQQAPISRLHCYAKDNSAFQEMSGLEHITRFTDGPVLAWGAGAFTGTPGQGAVSGWQWQPYDQPYNRIGPEMIVEDGTERWKLLASQAGQPMRVTHLGGQKTWPVASRFKCDDVSQVVADKRWIYVPVRGPKGGLLRIAKNEITP